MKNILINVSVTRQLILPVVSTSITMTERSFSRRTGVTEA